MPSFDGPVLSGSSPVEGHALAGPDTTAIILRPIQSATLLDTNSETAHARRCHADSCGPTETLAWTHAASCAAGGVMRNHADTSDARRTHAWSCESSALAKEGNDDPQTSGSFDVNAVVGIVSIVDPVARPHRMRISI